MPDLHQINSATGRFVWLRRRLTLPILAIEVGLLAGFSIRAVRPPAPYASIETAVPPPLLASPCRPKTASDFDELYRVGDFQAAIDLCDDLLQRESAERTVAYLRYGRALCVEARGNLREAAEAYAMTNGQPLVVDAAHLGSARCALRTGDFDRAHKALRRFARDPAPESSVGLRLFAEAKYLEAALAVAPFAAPPGGRDKSGPASVAVPMPPDTMPELVSASLAPVEGRGSDPPKPESHGESTPDWSVIAARWERVLAEVPESHFRDHARLELGNAEFRRGRLREAARHYGVLVVQPTPVGRAAAYNLGLCRHRGGEFAAARQSLFNVIDSGPADELSSLSWWWIGRAYLDGGDSQAAILPFRRAVASENKTIRRFGALGVAAAHLVGGNAAAAHSALKRYRRHLFAEPERSFAAVLDSLACDITNSRLAGKVDRSELLDAGLEYRNRPPIGPASVYLLGQAFRRAGIASEMVRLYEEAIPTCRGPLAIRMTADVAEFLFDTGRMEIAKGHYYAIAQTDRGELAELAYRRLAEAALFEGRIDECIEFCRSALALPGRQVRLFLPIMGRAYERRGDNAEAALCYAGIVSDTR